MNINTSTNSCKALRRLFNNLVAAIVFGLLPASDYAQTADQTTAPATNAPARPRMRENVPANPNLPSLYFVGDSTVRNGQGTGTGGQWGWGDELAPLFDTSKINVVNRAVGGTTSRTFYRDLWQNVLAMLKPGDFVLMQFGTNGGAVNDASRAPAAAKFTASATRRRRSPIMVTKKFEVVHSFGWYEKQMIADARSKGATPMVCSLIPRNAWRDGKAARSGADTAADWAGRGRQGRERAVH